MLPTSAQLHSYFFFRGKKETYGKGNYKKQFDVRKIDLTHFNALMLDPCSPVKAMSENFSFTKIVECSMAIAVLANCYFSSGSVSWVCLGCGPLPRMPVSTRIIIFLRSGIPN